MRPTRGHGRLEGFIAKLRMAKALKAVRPDLRGGEVLDIGCGSYPLFLIASPFARKVGVDQVAPAWAAADKPPPELAGLEILQVSLAGRISLPFADGSFGCVTSLACMEHLEPACLPSLASEIRRVLRPAGQVILTMPDAKADGVLRVMARLGLVSKEEIEEHKSLFRHRDIRELLRHAGFAEEKIRVRGFQFGLNIVAVAEK
jgi:SAM-dependent methyltransferase